MDKCNDKSKDDTNKPLIPDYEWKRLRTEKLLKLECSLQQLKQQVEQDIEKASKSLQNASQPGCRAEYRYVGMPNSEVQEFLEEKASLELLNVQLIHATKQNLKKLQQNQDEIKRLRDENERLEEKLIDSQKLCNEKKIPF